MQQRTAVQIEDADHTDAGAVAGQGCRQARGGAHGTDSSEDYEDSTCAVPRKGGQDAGSDGRGACSIEESKDSTGAVTGQGCLHTRGDATTSSHAAERTENGQSTEGAAHRRPQFAEKTVELVRLVPQERVQWVDKQLKERVNSTR